jgi:hypothetical protein
MSIAPYNNYSVLDLSGSQQPYVNSTTEFGYFGSRGAVSNLYSMPTYLNTNNGIAIVDASGGLNILQAGIYTLDVSIDYSATSMTISPTNSFGIIYFNFGTNKLNAISIANITGSFGGTRTSGMFSYGSNTTYPGIIDWLVNSFTTGANTTPSKYYIKNNQLMWGYACNNFSNGGPLSSGICTTKITFIINQPTIIYLNTCCIDINGSLVYTLTMGKSYFTLQLINKFPAPNWTTINWTQGIGAPYNAWYKIANSSTGQYVVAVAFSTGIYKSSDYGVNWSKLTNAPAQNWYSISSDSTGQKLVAGIYNGTIYYSSDGGTSWSTSTGAPSTQWISIASDSTGQLLAAVGINGGIYYSSNYGPTWNIITGTSGILFSSISSSSSGQYLAAVRTNGYIYVSNNYGISGSWTDRNTTVSTTWGCITTSSSGQYMAAGVGSLTGYIYLSSDYGVTWAQSTSVITFWNGITSSSSGQYLAAGTNDGKIYISSNSGVTWNQSSNAPVTTSYYSISSSSSGQYIYAGSAGGTPYSIYRGVYS